MAELSFRLLGRVGLAIDGEPVTVPPKTAAVLARLLLARSALVPVDELYLDVWGSPGRSVNRGDRVAVQKRISELRGLLGPAVLVTDAGAPTAYRLVVEPEWVDAFRFEAATAAGDERAALALWHDEPLFGLGDRPFAAAAAKAWTDLRDRLGRTPAPPPIPAPQAAAGPVRGLPPVWRMPSRITGFVPRQGPLTALHDVLPAGPGVLCGIGGAGKTRLAVEFAYRHAADYDLAWWVDADDADRIGDQLAALGVAVGACGPNAATPAAVAALNRHLHALPPGRCLIVFDNADAPERLVAHLPVGLGHTVITSRNPQWTEVATAVPVDVFDRPQSVALLRGRVDGLTDTEADQLAERLGDLPLALAQAAGVIAAQGKSPAEYLAELSAHAADATDAGRPASYPRSLAAAVTVAADRLAPDDRAMLDLSTVFAPEAIPTDVLRTALDGDAARLRSGLEHVVRYGLAQLDTSGLLVHRLTQAILRDALTAEAAATLHRLAERAVGEAAPGDVGDDPLIWPRWQALIPHVLALDPGDSDDAGLRDFAVRIPRYLLVRGDHGPGRRLAEQLYEAWRQRLGPDHRHTLAAASALSMALGMSGENGAGAALGNAALARQRAALGEDDPDTLLTESILTMILPDGAEGLAAAEHNYQAHLRVLGAEHHDTLWAQILYANRLSVDGQATAALEHARAAADGMQRALGDTHPMSSQTLGALGSHLRRLGRLDEARTALEQALPRLDEMFGPAHPETLSPRAEYALTLSALGHHDQAIALARRVAALYVETMGAEHPLTIELLDDLAVLLNDAVEELDA